MPKHVNGTTRTVKVLRTSTATQRALEAVELMRAAGYSFRKARRATGCSVGYLRTALNLTAAQFDLVRRGIIPLAHFHTSAAPISNRVVDRFIQWAGADCVMAALDRLTTPSLIAAE
jgi:hypothetical protein